MATLDQAGLPPVTTWQFQSFTPQAQPGDSIVLPLAASNPVEILNRIIIHATKNVKGFSSGKEYGHYFCMLKNGTNGIKVEVTQGSIKLIELREEGPISIELEKADTIMMNLILESILNKH
jgi:hypothetical protein